MELNDPLTILEEVYSNDDDVLEGHSHYNTFALDGDDRITSTDNGYLQFVIDVNGSYNAAVHNRAAPASAPEPNYAPLPLSHEDELVNLQLDVV